jgi:hypothetical protein
MNEYQSLSQVEQCVQSRQPITDVASSNNYTNIWVGNHIVGAVRGGEFIKKVKGSRHFLRKPPSIAFDLNSIEEARTCGANSVRIIDKETGKIYQAFISTIFAKGFQVNRGYGKQIGLEFRYWQCGNSPLVTQLSFGGDI